MSRMQVNDAALLLLGTYVLTKILSFVAALAIAIWLVSTGIKLE